MEIKNDKDKALFQEMIGASDRAAAITVTAYLDESLEMAIVANLKDDKDTLNRLFKPTGPVGAFGTKISLGYVMGLYTSAFRSDLETYAGIRNKFAHWAKPLDFAHKEIRTAIEGIGFYPRMFPESVAHGEKPPFSQGWARYVFVSNADGMAGQLRAIARSPKTHPRIL